MSLPLSSLSGHQRIIIIDFWLSDCNQSSFYSSPPSLRFFFAHDSDYLSSMPEWSWFHCIFLSHHITTLSSCTKSSLADSSASVFGNTFHCQLLICHECQRTFTLPIFSLLCLYNRLNDFQTESLDDNWHQVKLCKQILSVCLAICFVVEHCPFVL